MTVEEFLALPLVARVAVSSPAGPTVRPVWFLYEDGAFYWLTASSYSHLEEWMAIDPRVAITIDTCDLTTGAVLAVLVVGAACVQPFDPALAARKFTKYLGPDREKWPERFRAAFEDPAARVVSLRPARPPRLRDLSFAPI